MTFVSIVRFVQDRVGHLFHEIAKFGLVDSRIGLAIVHTILQLPFSVYLMRNAFEAVPREIEEAAMVDGCSALRRLTHIFLPLAVPGLVTVALFAFINSWNEWGEGAHLEPDLDRGDDRLKAVASAVQRVSSARGSRAAW